MGLVAVIKREPRLTETEWLNCIAQNPELFGKKEPRVIVNPFTHKEVLWTPRPTEVQVVDASGLLGAIEDSPEFDENGELHIYSATNVTPRLEAIIRRIALLLGADVEWMPPDMM